MSENKRDYAVGRGKPPVHTRFKKGAVRQPARTAPEKPAGAVDRGARRAGDGDDRPRAAVDPIHRGAAAAPPWDARRVRARSTAKARPNVFISAALKANSLPFLVVRWIDRRDGLLKSMATEKELSWLS
jgi:hypothetical protein